MINAISSGHNSWQWINTENSISMNTCDNLPPRGKESQSSDMATAMDVDAPGNSDTFPSGRPPDYTMMMDSVSQSRDSHQNSLVGLSSLGNMSTTPNKKQTIKRTRQQKRSATTNMSNIPKELLSSFPAKPKITRTLTAPTKSKAATPSHSLPNLGAVTTLSGANTTVGAMDLAGPIDAADFGKLHDSRDKSPPTTSTPSSNCILRTLSTASDSNHPIDLNVKIDSTVPVTGDIHLHVHMANEGAGDESTNITPRGGGPDPFKSFKLGPWTITPSK
jgi:hypothetical protein